MQGEQIRKKECSANHVPLCLRFRGLCTARVTRGLGSWRLVLSAGSAGGQPLGPVAAWCRSEDPLLGGRPTRRAHAVGLLPHPIPPPTAPLPRLTAYRAPSAFVALVLPRSFVTLQIGFSAPSPRPLAGVRSGTVVMGGRSASSVRSRNFWSSISVQVSGPSGQPG